MEMRNCCLEHRSGKGCNGTQCKNCGWNAAERARRERLLRKQGLTLGADGLLRLVIKRRRKKAKEEDSAAE